MKKKHKYQDSIVTFIDVLGFSELVKSGPIEKVTEVLDLVKTCTHADPADPFGPKVFAFSDSIIRVRPASQPSALVWELTDLLHVQGGLTYNDIFVRGGVAFGEVAIAKREVFGPAFLEAYELESKVAVYPRIVISPHLLRQLGHKPLVPIKDWESDIEFVKDLVQCGDDGVWSIDYLRRFENEVDGPEEYIGWLAEHRDAVIRMCGAANPRTFSSVSVKANWLAHYHNSYIRGLNKRNLGKYGVDIDELVVSSDRLPIMFEF